MCVCVCSFVRVCVIHVFTFLFNKTNKISDFRGSHRHLEPGTVVLEVVGTLFSQNLYKTLPSSDPSRVLVVFWLIFAFVVGTAYRGNLTAALTLPKYPPKPETLSEVVQTVRR